MPSLQSIGKSFGVVNDKFGDKKVCVITGTSSGLGKQTAKHLVRTGRYHVICAVRDVEKMYAVAEDEEFDPNCFSVHELDLNSFASVRKFADDLKVFISEKPLDRLVCNAAVYQPTLSYAKYSEDGIEQQAQINFLSHFLLISLLVRNVLTINAFKKLYYSFSNDYLCFNHQMPSMKGAEKPRIVTVGSVTGNDNTGGGGGVYPIADLRDLAGLEAGAKEVMIHLSLLTQDEPKPFHSFSL